jgi:amino acid transporter
VFGWILLLAVTFAIPDVAGTLKAGAFDVQYIWQQSLGNAWAEFLLFVVVAAQFFCDNADVTASSRILWALSRDKAVPFHNQVRKLNRWGAPAVAVWTIVIFDILWMVPTFWNATIGYLVATSISVIALYGAYAMPIFLRLRQGSRFTAGDWNLGKHYKWLGGLALAWITIITILFIMPVTPDGIPFRAGFSWDVFNYAPLTMVSFLVLVGGWWLLSARKWFRGPVAQGTFEELEALDRTDGSALVTVTDTGDTALAEDPELGAGQ